MPSYTLKGGFITEDPRLDRLPEFDDASRNFPIRELLPDQVPLRGRSWWCPAWLDQGQEGACVGFAWAHELAAYPFSVKNLDNSFARNKIYIPAQFIDEWAGEAYSGTSVIAGAKIVKSLGFMTEYRWCFGIDDVLDTLTTSMTVNDADFGPIVLGINWRRSMFEPRPSGLLEVSPGNAGGHAILLRGLITRPRLKGEANDEPIVRLRNSWGVRWGLQGDCYMKVSDLETLLNERGEACVPVRRLKQAA